MCVCVNLALALEALFKLKIIHRDIKPQNLLLSYPMSSSLSHSTSIMASPSSSMSSQSSSLINKRPFTDATIKLGTAPVGGGLFGWWWFIWLVVVYLVGGGLFVSVFWLLQSGS